MAEDNPTPTPDPEPEGTTLSDSELEELIGNAVDTRMTAFEESLGERLSPLENLNLEEFRTSLLDDIRGLLPTSSGFDENKFLGRVDRLLNDRMGHAGDQKPERQPGAISRWLGFGNPT